METFIKCKIESVLDSKDPSKNSEQSSHRVGRICYVVIDSLKRHSNLTAVYNDNTHFTTTKIVRIHDNMENHELEVETINSIYKFEVIE